MTSNILPFIPTAISPREARFMQQIADDREVIEYGALLGFSTVVLARAAATLVSVDRHDGYSGETLRPYLSNLDRYGVRVTAVQDDCLSWAGHKADVAFIDLTGQYQLTKDMLLHLASPLALIHDLDRPRCDVDRAIKDAVWRPIGQVDTLVLCERAA